MKYLFYALRVLLAVGGVLLLASLFCPYILIPLGQWVLPVNGMFLSGWANILAAGAALWVAKRGRGPIGVCWLAGGLAAYRLHYDVYVCHHDVAMLLGKIQLSLGGINRVLTQIGLPPLHLFDVAQVRNRALDLGFDLAFWGLVILGVSCLIWTVWKGWPSLLSEGKYCICGRWVRDPQEYCPFCGHCLVEGVICAHCSKPMLAHYLYCPHCGRKNNRS